MTSKRKAVEEAASSPKKQSKVLDYFASPTKIQKSVDTQKPVLVILPGASGFLSKAMNELLLPKLRRSFEVRVSEGKWQGWNPASQVDRVLQHCPTTAEPWYIMGHSFGNRVICAMFEEARFSHPPAAVVLGGYPMHSDKQTPERINALQSLPSNTKVMFISGSDDEFLSRSPDGISGEALLQHVTANLACAETCTIHIVQGGKHGIIDCGKKAQERAVQAMLTWITEHCSV